MLSQREQGERHKLREPPRYRCDFKITNYNTKKVIEESIEDQYIDSIKTDIYKKHDRRFNKIEMEIERLK